MLEIDNRLRSIVEKRQRDDDATDFEGAALFLKAGVSTRTSD